jgi:hypothetical protein
MIMEMNPLQAETSMRTTGVGARAADTLWLPSTVLRPCPMLPRLADGRRTSV